MSQEFSISEINDKYLLVCQIGSSVAVRFGQSPVGPFDFYNEVYKCPEVNISGNVFVYNAKAHPSLSDNNSLLISYNVNTLSLSENINNADIYRPRFIKLTINENGADVKEEEELPAAFKLFQNYPNPFNPSTTIEYVIPSVETGYIPSLQQVTLKVYDILGREVATLINEEQTAGKYFVQFNAAQISNLRRNLSSGVYFYTLRVGDSSSSDKSESSEFKETKKMVFVK
ncbi:MAG: T9SS type A sorting domain-containing protein [Ignavibacteriales bacterium]|nr:T9SS type A sorting domain-containing protein [Ignavibacteriales bacterium]